MKRFLNIAYCVQGAAISSQFCIDLENNRHLIVLAHLEDSAQTTYNACIHYLSNTDEPPPTERYLTDLTDAEYAFGEFEEHLPETLNMMAERGMRFARLNT